jgi:pimeloyl-ACP methyl ester carboxylesterase
MDHIYPGPFQCYYDRHETGGIRSALATLKEIIKEDGPFDGVIGFSQGAALAASLLLCHQSDTPQKSPPFKVAVFIAGGLPLSPSSDFGKDVTEEAQSAERSGGLQLERKLGPGKGNAQVTIDGPQSDEKKDPESRVFSFDPDVFSRERIGIPTVHIIGSKDPWLGYSKSLIKLCRTDLAKVRFHNGVHEVPRTPASLRQCAEQIESAIGMTQLLRW